MRPLQPVGFSLTLPSRREMDDQASVSGASLTPIHCARRLILMGCNARRFLLSRGNEGDNRDIALAGA